MKTISQTVVNLNSKNSTEKATAINIQQLLLEGTNNTATF